MADKNYTPIDKPIKKDKDTNRISLPKEVEPLAAEKFEIQEVVEHEPDEEIEKFISPRAETIKLPPDLKKLGLQAVSHSKFPGFKNIKLPISDEKIIVGQRAPITSSLRWLATLALYILGQAHLGLKVIHGHVVRVFKK